MWSISMKAAVQVLAFTKNQTQGHRLYLQWEACRDGNYWAYAQVGQGKNL